MKSDLFRLIALATMYAVCASAALAQQSSPEPVSGMAASKMPAAAAQSDKKPTSEEAVGRSLIDMERLWAEVCASHDTSVLQRVLADDFLGTNTDGKLYTKSEDIEKVQKSRNKFLSGRLDNVKFRFFGDNVAVLYGMETCMKSMDGGKQEPEINVWTDTWLKRKGRWQIVAAQDMRSAPTALAAERQNAPAPFRVLPDWPTLPRDFALGQVSGVAVDSHNHVFVFHRGGQPWTDAQPKVISAPAVLMLDAGSGRILRSWGENTFYRPHGLRIDSADNVWITDVYLQQVMKFTHDGKLLLSLGERGIKGDDDAHFNQPTDVAFSQDGSFYVSDGYGNSRVMQFSAAGRFIRQWGKPGSGSGEFHLPHSITTDSAGRVYVADRENGRIQIFSPIGEFVAQWKPKEFVRPFAITSAPDGSLYVVDAGSTDGVPTSRAFKINTQGEIIAQWSSWGHYAGQFHCPHDIATAKDGSVYIGEVCEGMRVQKFVPTG